MILHIRRPAELKRLIFYSPMNYNKNTMKPDYKNFRNMVEE